MRDNIEENESTTEKNKHDGHVYIYTNHKHPGTPTPARTRYTPAVMQLGILPLRYGPRPPTQTEAIVGLKVVGDWRGSRGGFPDWGIGVLLAIVSIKAGLGDSDQR